MLRTEKEDIQRAVASSPTETQTRIVKDTQIHRPEPQADRASQIEINNLAARGRQHAEALQANLAQTKLFEAVQKKAVTVRRDVVGATAADKLLVPKRLVQSIDIVERKPDPLDAIPQVSPEHILIEDKQEHVEATIIETPALLEEFDIEGLDFEPPEKSLAIDNAYLETGIIEEDKEGIDTLLADLEEGMQQVEAEYMGELLVAMFAGFTETESIEDVADIDTHLSQAVPLEVAEDVPTISETTLIEGFEKEFSLYLESLDPTQVEPIENVIEEFRVVLKESQQLAEETTSEENETIDQKLENLCIQLFEGLGIEYDEEIIKQFIQSVTAQESFSNANIESSELSIDELNYLGTREYKSLGSASLLGGLAHLIKQKMQPHFVIGRYALQVLQPSF